MSVSSPVGGNTLREDIARALWLKTNPSGATWEDWPKSDKAHFYRHADTVLAVVAPHLDAAETALGKVRALAEEALAMNAPPRAVNSEVVWLVEDIRAALASAEATADTQDAS